MKDKTINFYETFYNKINSFKNIYIKHIHSKWYAPLLYGVVFLLLLFLGVLLNIMYMARGNYSFTQVFKVLGNWTDDKDGVISTVDFSNLSGPALTHFQRIQVGWYNISATLLGGIGMTLAALTTQSLTKNPIAEGSTLGLVQAGIFGVVFAISYGLLGIASRYIFIIMFSSIGALLILGFVIFNKKRNGGMQKIILAGLAIGIIFKTLTFIFKAGDANNNVVSFAYVLGGAESISGTHLALGHDEISIMLLISFVLIILAIALTIINIKGMNILEIGDERAKNLGSSIRTTRILNILILLLALPAAVILVGNMAFLGLFSVHLARWLMKSINYKKVVPASLIIGMAIATIGLQLTMHFPKVNSGIWMTFIGAPYLIYIGIRGLK